MNLKMWLTLLLTGLSLFAQSSGGTLTGKVTDENGAALPNTVVIVVDTATNRAQRTVSGTDGSFSFANLSTGTYRVDIEGPSGTRTGQQTIQIASNQAANIEVVFGASAAGGGQAGAVAIKATTPMLQTETAEVARAYETRPIRSLPVLDREVEEFIGLMPGVTPPTADEDRLLNPQHRRTYNVNGLPDWANAAQQDGAYNTEPFQGKIARVAPNPSIQALNIRTSNYNAEHGVAGGSWTNVVTRPGTNQIHGSVFEFNTNGFLATRSPIVPSNVSVPNFTQNQFGGSVGGPAIPDRMFWFLSYEGRIRRGSDLNFATVPTAELRSGNFTGIPNFTLFDLNGNPVPNNQIPSSQINARTQAISNLLPLPNQSGFSNNLVGTTRSREDNHRVDGKVDYRFTDKTTGFLRYGYTPAYIERGSLLGLLGDAGSANMRNHSAVASVTQEFGVNLLAEFRFGYQRYRNRIAPLGDFSTLDQQLGQLGFTNGLPQIDIAGLSPLGLPGNYPSKAISNIWNPATNWNLHTGMHTLKFGVDAHVLRSSGFESGFFSPNGSFEFGPGPTSRQTGNPGNLNVQASSFGAFLLGAPTQSGVSSFVTTPTDYQNQFGAYITDSINLWHTLHLELGVRYDVFGPLSRRGDTGTFLFDAVVNNIANNPATYSTNDYDLNNIAPRVGFTFQPIKRMVLRGGYSLQYFPVPFQLAGLNQNILAAQAGVAGSFGRTAFAVPSVNTNTTTGALNSPLYVSPTRVNTPYVQAFNVMIQADMSHGFLLDLGYLGNVGRQLPYSRVLNAALPGTGIAGIPGATNSTVPGTLFERNTGLNSNYNSLQANLTKRFSSGLAFSGAYTFSKALDYGYNLNPFSTSFSYGPADWDRAHIFSLSHLWQLPFGQGKRQFRSGWTAQAFGNWELNGILRWATGTPYTVSGNPLYCNCPGATSGVRADFNGSAGTSLNGAINLDPSLFSLPSSGSFGSTGRNGFRGPDMFTYNMSLFRNFQVRDNFKLELRGEAYNLTNSANYANPLSSIGSAGFGSPVRTFDNMGGRQFQLAARILF